MQTHSGLDWLTPGLPHCTVPHSAVQCNRHTSTIVLLSETCLETELHAARGETRARFRVALLHCLQPVTIHAGVELSRAGRGARLTLTSHARQGKGAQPAQPRRASAESHRQRLRLRARLTEPSPAEAQPADATLSPRSGSNTTQTMAHASATNIDPTLTPTRALPEGPVDSTPPPPPPHAGTPALAAVTVTPPPPPPPPHAGAPPHPNGNAHAHRVSASEAIHTLVWRLKESPEFKMVTHHWAGRTCRAVYESCRLVPRCGDSVESTEQRLFLFQRSQFAQSVWRLYIFDDGLFHPIVERNIIQEKDFSGAFICWLVMDVVGLIFLSVAYETAS